MSSTSYPKHTLFYTFDSQHPHSLPDNCTFDHAALAEPLSVLIHAARRAGLSSSTPGQSVLVFGVGAIGLLACALAKSYGASHVVAIDINKQRLDFAKEQGFAQETYCLPLTEKAKTADDQLRRAKDTISAALTHFDMADGFDVVFECTGAEPCIQMSIHVSTFSLLPSFHNPSTTTSNPRLFHRAVDAGGTINTPITTCLPSHLSSHTHAKR